MYGGACYPAMVNVADNRHLQAVKFFLVAQDCVTVEQGLRRMLVHAIAWIYHRDVKMGGHQMRRASMRMTHHDEIGSNRAQSVGGIEQRFAFFYARSTRENQSSCRTQRLGRNLERRAGTRGRLVKQQQHLFPAQ